jgi:hypothetical protein
MGSRSRSVVEAPARISPKVLAGWGLTLITTPRTNRSLPNFYGVRFACPWDCARWTMAQKPAQKRSMRTPSRCEE